VGCYDSALFHQVGGGGRAFDPVNVPGGVGGDEREGIGAEPGLVDHFGGEPVEGTRILFDLVAVAGEGRVAFNHCVGLVSSMPVLAHVNGFGGADHQLRRFGFWVHVQDTDLRGSVAEVGNDLVPLHVFVVGEHG